jgi:hypothetical protein
MRRRRNGFDHIRKTKNCSLDHNLPKDISREQVIYDMELILETRDYHSEEISESDDDKANRERRNRERYNNRNNRVIKVLDKSWRSKKVILR